MRSSTEIRAKVLAIASDTIETIAEQILNLEDEIETVRAELADAIAEREQASCDDYEIVQSIDAAFEDRPRLAATPSTERSGGVE